MPPEIAGRHIFLVIFGLIASQPLRGYNNVYSAAWQRQDPQPAGPLPQAARAGAARFEESSLQEAQCCDLS
jgi:hypothetical protein